MSLRQRINAAPVPKMPSGIVELMDGLARDVLKNNPENIYDFCAHHMQKLLEMRDGNAPKQFMTLEQKIAKAQKTVKQRAERRQSEIYKKFITVSNTGNNQNEAVTLSKPKSDVDHVMDVSEKQEIKTVEISKIKQKETEPPVQFGSTALKSDENSDISTESVLGNVDNLEIKETKESDSNTNQETASSNLVEKEYEADNTKDNADKNLSDISKEQHVVTQENLFVTDSDTKRADENDVDNIHEEQPTSNTTPTPQEEQREFNTTTTTQREQLASNSTIAVGEQLASNSTSQREQLEPNSTTTQGEQLESNTTTFQEDQLASNTQLELNDKSEEKITTEQSGEVQLKGIVQSDNDIQISIKETAVKNTGHESSSNNITGRAVSPSTLATLSNTSEDNLHANANTQALEVQNDKSINNSLNKDSDKNDTEKEYTKKDLGEQQKQQDDEKILAVILNKPGYIQSNNLDSLANDDIHSKFKGASGTERVEIKDGKVINSSMDLETAAITIQKVFRSFLFKTKTASSYDDPTTVDINLLNEDKDKEENDTSNVKDRRLLGISRMDTVLQTVNEEKSLSLSTDDSSTFSSAATIIQAHVRGFLVRSKFNSNKTISTNSLIDSDAPSTSSLEADIDNRKNKTVLNIHIVPEGGHFVSRDESILTSMDLSLDGSPPSSVNLHPLGYDKSERRKQLKREDAIQSVSPPSNNSGKLSDDLDSMREMLVEPNAMPEAPISDDKYILNSTPNIIIISEDKTATNNGDSNVDKEIADIASDEMDVITPFTPVEGRSSRESVNSSKLLHSGEFHDVVVPTNVTRCDTTVVREFQNVLVYFILWNN